MSTSARGVLDLSSAAGKEQDLSDLPFEKAMLPDIAPEEVRELNVMHAQVVSLTSAPGALINDVFHNVTVLRAAHNQLSDLRGIEAFSALEVLDLSYNCLRVVDAHGASLLRTLKQLRSIDFSHNDMVLLDLSGLVGAPSSRLSGAGTGVSSTSSFTANGINDARGSNSRLSPSISDSSDGFPSLTTMNLSYNAFIDLPDLRSAPYLRVLNISHTKIDSLVDLDCRLPLLSLHALALHANQLSTPSALAPLCGLAHTLKHIQIFRNPFTLLQGRPKTMSGSAEGGQSSLRTGRLDTSMWWRPFLLWLCPLLETVDQVEFTASERRVAGIMLFRENGLLSKARMELMNPHRKDDLGAYLRRMSESATPRHDIMSVIEGIEREEESQWVSSGGESGSGQVVASATHTNIDQSRIAAPVFSSTNSIGSMSLSVSPGPITVDAFDQTIMEAMPATQPSRGGGRTAGRSSSGARVVVIAPEGPLSRHCGADGALIADHIRQPTHTTSMTSLVRALQRKLRSLEEIVSVLWQADMLRRTRAAIMIQRVMRSALARMHLSEEDAESCRFIRYQLQQAAISMAGQTEHGASGAALQENAAGDGGNGSVGAATRGGSQRLPSLEPVADTGSNMQEVLVSMRSLQEVMSNMWVDLGEYRAMADRERRRAAVLIQRHYRGYQARCKYGRARSFQHLRSLPPAPSACDAGCKCTSEAASLREEVGSLRSEVRELRLLLEQSVDRKRLSVYNDPEQVMDAIIRKHTARVGISSVAEPPSLPQTHAYSPSLNTMSGSMKHTAGEMTSPGKTADAIAGAQGLAVKKGGVVKVSGANNDQFTGSATLSLAEFVSMSHPPEQTLPMDNVSPSAGYTSSQPTRITKVRSRAVSLSNSNPTEKS